MNESEDVQPLCKDCGFLLPFAEPEETPPSSLHTVSRAMRPPLFPTKRIFAGFSPPPANLKGPVVSNEAGVDQFCAFFEFHCPGCQAKVGRVYASVSSDLDVLINRLLLYHDSVTKGPNFHSTFISQDPNSVLDRALLDSGDEPEAEEKTRELDKVRQSQNEQLRNMKMALVDFADVVTHLESRMRKAEEDVISMKGYITRIMELINSNKN